MKIVLLVLSSDPDTAGEWLQQKYPGARLELLSRKQLEKRSPLGRVGLLRSLRPDVFAVATERLAWQSGQNALKLFGVLAGARRFVLFDTTGNYREETRAAILALAPIRLATESVASGLAIARAHSALRRLERSINSRANARSPTLNKKRSQKLQIAYLRTTPAAGTQFGGATTHTLGFINAAVGLGAHLSVISNDRIAGLDETKVSMKLIEPESLGLTRATFDLRNGLLFTGRACTEIGKELPDFIYQRYSRFNWTGVEVSLRSSRPLFLEYNGSEVWMAKHWGRLRLGELLKRCERLNLAAATRIFVVAEVERNNLVKMGVAADKIVVNPNGVDVEEFHPAIGGAAMRHELGLADNETLSGFVGTFGPWHGVLTLAEAITLLPPDHRFLLVGAGMFRDEVERIIGEAGRTRQVIFAGQVNHNRVPELLDACDILLSPHVPMSDGSEFFGSPTKLFEYMAMGKAIVASRLGQIGEVLTDEETALLVEPGNARALADAILRLGRSPELRERLGGAARRAAIERHTWKQNAQRVLDEYRSVVIES
jgi:glycosyltransferase involved in cell wall biosynthesis